MQTKEITQETKQRQIMEMADAHCHLDLMDAGIELSKWLAYGVRTIITNGVDTKSNIRSAELADNRNIFAMLGMDPEHANVTDEELEFNIKMIRHNHSKIAGIGEIGLDFGTIKEKVTVARQKVVFERFLDLAKELRLPVSIHSRNAISEVLQILEEKGMEYVHIHFFEGNAQQARAVEKKGYMISVPPIHSSKRNGVIKEIAIDNIMPESDAPIVGASPIDVYKSIEIVAEAKRIDVKKAAELLTRNTKRFFRVREAKIMRY